MLSQILYWVSYILYKNIINFCESKSLLLSKKGLILFFKLNLINLTIDIRLLLLQIEYLVLYVLCENRCKICESNSRILRDKQRS